MEKLRKAAGYIGTRLEKIPETAVVLGSGLGGFTALIKDKKEIAYAEIPHFPTTSVKGHAGRLICGSIDGKDVLCLSGRVHFYEGFSMSEVAFYVGVLKLIGVKNLVVTNAAEAVNKEFSPGDLMVVTDHIKLCADSPIRGDGKSELGERFVDLTNCYDKNLIEIAKTAAANCGIDIKTGVYAFMSGPNYETPAEIKMLSYLGADAVGMSTVPEAIMAAKCGIKTLAVSCITNMAAGIAKEKLSHEEVFNTADRNGTKMEKLLKKVISLI